jgi:hypothetical protein
MRMVAPLLRLGCFRSFGKASIQNNLIAWRIKCQPLHTAVVFGLCPGQDGPPTWSSTLWCTVPWRVPDHAIVAGRALGAERTNPVEQHRLNNVTLPAHSVSPSSYPKQSNSMAHKVSTASYAQGRKSSAMVYRPLACARSCHRGGAGPRGRTDESGEQHNNVTLPAHSVSPSCWDNRNRSDCACPPLLFIKDLF